MYSLWIVEDERMTRESLIDLVPWTELGYQVTGVYCDGVDCLAHLQRSQPAVILTDIKMANTDGVGIAQYISDHALPVQIIFMSAYQEFDFARKAVEYGVAHYLLKPISLAELCDVLRKIRAKLDGKDHNNSNKMQAQALTSDLRNGTSAKRVMQYIEDHYREDISLDSVSRILHFNPGYVSRLLKEQTGKNFTHIVAEKRIALAVWYLENTNLHVYDIAKRVGYQNTKYFYSIFKKVTGKAPNDYRSISDG